MAGLVINGRLLMGGLVITEQLPMSSLLGLAGLFYFQCLRAEPNLGHRFLFLFKKLFYSLDFLRHLGVLL